MDRFDAIDRDTYNPPCLHMLERRFELMQEIDSDYSKLPEIDHVHRCKVCGIECDEYGLWQEFKRIFD